MVDFGGVLTTSLRTNAEEFERSAGLAPGAYRAALAHPAGARVYADLETGRAAQRDWNEVIGGLLGIETENLMGRVLGPLRLEDQVVDAVAAAGASGAVTALLSNSFGLEPFNVYAELDLLDLFDVVVLSEREGVRKPDPEIYRRTVGRMGLAPRRCVFVDDREVNLPPARSLGIHPLLHTDPTRTASLLSEWFGPQKDMPAVDPVPPSATDPTRPEGLERH
ncbi:HAD-IA family hydrolase [Streptomyces sp. NPDC007905]|uniref:HAD-IA family hydrolase n=1 Tax=Streptomyces sp. NPDC007905 TaxID=3364788 RepID=UPI0036E101B4